MKAANEDDDDVRLSVLARMMTLSMINEIGLCEGRDQPRVVPTAVAGIAEALITASGAPLEEAITALANSVRILHGVPPVEATEQPISPGE